MTQFLFNFSGLEIKKLLYFLFEYIFEVFNILRFLVYCADALLSPKVASLASLKLRSQSPNALDIAATQYTTNDSTIYLGHQGEHFYN